MAAKAPAAPTVDEYAGIPGIASFTRERVERVMAVSVAIGILALGAQGFFASIGAPDVRPGWLLPLQLLTFVPLVLTVISFFSGTAVRTFGTIFVAAYVIVLLLWPMATAGSQTAITFQPWIYFIVNVATVAAVIVMPFRVHLVVTIAIPVLYCLVRMVEAQFVPEAWIAVVLDSSYSLILGSVLMMVGWTFRTAATTIDDRRARAVSSYAQAAAVNATERERVAVAALMHDSVLAALIAAERAETPRERDLAVSMAREALTRLANTDRDVGEGSDAPVPADSIVDGIRNVLVEMRADADIRVQMHPDTPTVPGRVARALVLAATQALANAVEHAGAADLTVTVEGRPAPEGVIITVQDAGGGFDIRSVPADRLGIRASILARVSAFGGEAVVDSDETGTRITMVWRSGAA
ncbi:ATP-binding protein [Microbacterium sp. cx-55]|uniref:sensor histidine kinase n=1 Tax=unclassified Microbacterium TaxID=2609290 RepID=UPI001CBF7A9D|nr:MULTISPECIES: ATP-binding protein [unclassified Microbacterium]MBZ4487070.1 ATP-binding protein [Microbacterium sp. cx-55]MCC4907863.1 ATP-binding protein [Microbacterium sp. cx-59]UGB35986.1 ATP-binding protein [Microbacterium sp. cx-55]